MRIHTPTPTKGLFYVVSLWRARLTGGRGENRPFENGHDLPPLRPDPIPFYGPRGPECLEAYGTEASGFQSADWDPFGLLTREGVK